MYMIYMSWLRQKTEQLEKLLIVPNTVRGVGGGVRSAPSSHRALRGANGKFREIFTKFGWRYREIKKEILQVLCETLVYP